MRLTIFLFICFNFSLCFAQKIPKEELIRRRCEESIPDFAALAVNPMEYFYRGLCENLDFAALAVLENQNCPQPVTLSYKEYKEQTCTSRYRIIKVLDAVSDTLKKKHLEVKEKPVSPYFRHRPILIFGKHENGILQVKEYEEIRGYFFPCYEEVECISGCSYIRNFSLLDTNIVAYMFHTIGTPYHDLKHLDNVDIIFYEYWTQIFKRRIEKAGKDFNEFQRRLVQNREPIKAIKIKNDFVALGAIKNVHPTSAAKQSNFYELNVAIETIFKNDAKIDSNTAIFINKEHLPLNWSCLASKELFLQDKPVYLFGNLKDGNLFIDSLIFPRDAFVFGDTIYDISMGFPLKELITYILPSNLSFDELEFGSITQTLWSGEYEVNGPECLKKDIVKMSIKYKDFYKDDRAIKEIESLDEKIKELLIESYSFYHFRCPNRSQIQYGNESCSCCRNRSQIRYENKSCSGVKKKIVWGRK